MESKKIRKQFIDFFKSKEHSFVRSSPVVPIDDPTLLFTNAGMNQFKPYFLEVSSPKFLRVVNSQKCIRVSGKHNDLEEVGVDDYHHTFFEMLGNWSFGDYYKKEAIKWHWELLTEVWRLDKNRLWVSIYKDDDEAEGIWKKYTDVSKDRILRFGDKENFWEMGNTGPCGPCTEVHYYIGDNVDNQSESGVNSLDDYREVCNLVFIQYNRLANGKLEDLKNKYIDTGLGFERITAILNNKKSNYDTDLFIPIINKISDLSGKPYNYKSGVPHRVISDHLRMLSFSIADGALPSNEGRGYVVRRVLRRASRFGRELGFSNPFLSDLIDTLINIMGETYPELIDKKEHIKKVLEAEEIAFGRTLDIGLDHFSKIIGSLEAKTIKGKDAFKLYDTYGFPIDLTELLARENGLFIDKDEFERCMEEQRSNAKKSSSFSRYVDKNEWVIVSDKNEQSMFIGYDQFDIETSVIKYKLLDDGLAIVLKHTPFYFESGGQVSDVGEICFNDEKIIEVYDVQNIDGNIIHYCKYTDDNLLFKSNVRVKIDLGRRTKIMSNHTATHLLHQSLKNHLGLHVQQAGSLVNDKRLRFDLTHYEKVNEETINLIDSEVNQIIRENIELNISIQDFEKAKEDGACALFGEKYEDDVRVVSIDNFSKELCGGTHVSKTGDIGLFKIVSESSVSSGVRRIEAVTGMEALNMVKNYNNIISEIKNLFNCTDSELADKIKHLIKTNKENEKKIQQLRIDILFKDLKEKIDLEKEVNGVKIMVYIPENLSDAKSLGDFFRNYVKSRGVLLAGSVINEKPISICAVTDDLIDVIDAIDVIRIVGKEIGGGGGGKPYMATAGGKNPDKLKVAIDMGKMYILERIN